MVSCGSSPVTCLYIAKNEALDEEAVTGIWFKSLTVEECTEHNSTIYLTFSPDGNMSVSPQSFLKFPVGSASLTHSQSDFLVETSGF